MKRKSYLLLLILATFFFSALNSHASETEIDRKYAELGGPNSHLGSPTTNEQACSDGVGRFRKYQNGVIFWSSSTGAHEVRGAIFIKWATLGYERSFLGYPTSDETGVGGPGDTTHRFNTFQNGAIYWTPETGAHEMHGAIFEKWKALGGSFSPVGYPVTDEFIASLGQGSCNNFQRGAIYWSPHTGANAIYGLIYAKWMALGGVKSILGFPTTDETGTPDPGDTNARFNNFKSGAIYWTPTTGAHEVYGDIYRQWREQGGASGRLGFPTSGELPDPTNTKRYNNFERGTLSRNATPVIIPPLFELPTPFVAVHDRTLSNVMAEHAKHTANGLRIISLSIYGNISSPRYACVWAKDSGPEQRVSFLTSAAGYQAFFDSSVADGFKPTTISATGTTADPCFASVFEKRPGPVPLTRFGLVSGPVSGIYDIDTFGYWCKWARENNQILRCAAVYGDNDNPRYAGIWEFNDSEAAWSVAFHDGSRRLVTNMVPEAHGSFQYYGENSLQAVFEAQSFWARPSFLTHSADGHYIELFRNDQVGDWVSRVNLTSSQYQAEFDRLVPQGYLPTCVQGAGVGSSTRFTAIFAKLLKPKARQLTMTGEHISGLNAFDEAMQDIAKQNGVRSASLALAKDGRLVYARAFTWAEDGYKITQPENIFRIASCSKPVTAVAIYQLMEAGRLNLDDRLIDHINLTLPPGAEMTPKFDRITIRNLLQHKSGIVRNIASDEDVTKFFASKGVKKTLPLSMSDVAAYMSTITLLYDPGNPPPGQEIYSNTGFLFLSLIVERELGKYFDAVNRNIFSKVGLTRPQVTGSETTDQGALEVVYEDFLLRVGQSVMNEDRKIVPLEYGTLNFNTWIGVGGLAMAPADYVRFLSVLHSGRGELLKPETVNAGDNIKSHGGLLVGAITYVEHFDNGVTMAVCFDKSVEGDYGMRLRDVMYALPASAWPAAPFDLFPGLGIR